MGPQWPLLPCLLPLTLLQPLYYQEREGDLLAPPDLPVQYWARAQALLSIDPAPERSQCLVHFQNQRCHHSARHPATFSCLSYPVNFLLANHHLKEREGKLVSHPGYETSRAVFRYPFHDTWLSTGALHDVWLWGIPFWVK